MSDRQHGLTQDNSRVEQVQAQGAKLKSSAAQCSRQWTLVTVTVTAQVLVLPLLACVLRVWALLDHVQVPCFSLRLSVVGSGDSGLSYQGTAGPLGLLGDMMTICDSQESHVHPRSRC